MGALRERLHDQGTQAGNRAAEAVSGSRAETLETAGMRPVPHRERHANGITGN